MEDEYTTNSPLLNDEEFTTLLSVEYMFHGEPVNDIAKQRVWRRIKRAGTRTRRGSHTPWYTAAAIVTGLIFIPFLAIHLDSQAPIETTWRPKGSELGPMAVQLTAYVLMKDTSLIPATGIVVPGTTLLFKLDLAQPTVVALALARNDEPPSVRFISELTAGSQVPLVRDSSAYGYTVETTDRSLRFCALGDLDREKIERSVQEIGAVWSKFSSSHCVEMRTP